MQITKKTYEKPVLQAERFIPNEYIAACWSIACSLGTEDCCKYDNNGNIMKDQNGNVQYDFSNATSNNGGGKHSRNGDGTGCGWAKNQYIYDKPGGGFGITEENVPTGSTLECTITSNITEISDNLYIEWTTSQNGTTWYHQGYIKLDEQNRPLHS